ncbi:MAG TPA: SMP-30/gluconolactonase/LRE family protein [Pseudonocardiaceae bacterium]|nr:SMP-30/gluconolactonase/LRE family protein [Pseudonocardiaceae bacterium]
MVAGIGSRVAGYRIDALIGRGGGGVVYRATHLRLGRTDALKLLTPGLAADPEFQRRFEREALMAGTLDHPHIVPVYDAGEADGVMYLAMRLVEGSDLATVIERAGGRLDLKRTSVILSQVASALDAAHAKGLVHRDVKPANILIGRTADVARADHAYLSDFGLTRRFVGSALSGTMVAGTPDYMAPELFRGEPTAPTIDVYALGCVAYACLGGSPPFRGDSFEYVMARHLSEPPPRISASRADLPAGVDSVLARAIAKNPTERYPSCGAFAAALRAETNAGAAASGFSWAAVDRTGTTMLRPEPPVPGSRKTSRRKIVVVAAVLVLVLGVLALAISSLSGSGELATAAPIPGDVYTCAIDPAGGVYFSTFGDARVYKVESSGKMKVVAGAGVKGDSGDNGPATKAQLRGPYGLAADGAGNLYIADSGSHRIRKVDPAGVITTAAGNGTPDSTGDGGPAVLATLHYPDGLTIDRNGDLYIAEFGGYRVRKIDRSGLITTVAGTGAQGYSGDGGPALRATFAGPRSVGVDAVGNLYIADTGNGRIRKVNAAGTITTIAGNGRRGGTGDGGPATAAELDNPRGIAVDQAGNVYIADSLNARIREVDTSGRIRTVAGNGIRGLSGDGGPATAAQLAIPDGVVVDRDNTLYIGDALNHRVRKVDTSGTITTFAGAGLAYPGDGGPANHANLDQPWGVSLGKDGRIYIADSNNHRVRMVGQNGEITTIAGTGAAGFSGDGGNAVDAQLNIPNGLLADRDGNVYIADTHNHRVRKVTPDGKIRTIAGIGQGNFSGDNGPAIQADLRYPIGLALGSDGSLYIAEGGNDRIRRVDPAGVITTVAGNGTGGYAGDGGPAREARLNNPAGVAADDAGNLYIADSDGNRVRKAGPDGKITTIAGNGSSDITGDGDLAIRARLNTPFGVEAGPDGSVYIADSANDRIRRIDPAGIITTFAGPDSSEGN